MASDSKATTTTATAATAAAAIPATAAAAKKLGAGGIPVGAPFGGKAVNTATHPDPMNFVKWIDDNRADFKPPVGNKLINGFGCQFKVMVVGGPNTRTDYHINRGEEFFYMVKGSMVLKVIDGGRPRDVVIREGHAFCLPGGVPHSPQRYADSYGLVLEHDRYDGELDGLRWYCQSPGCGAVVYEKFFVCEDLGSQLKVLINAYYGDAAMRTCAKCKTVDQKVPLLTFEQAEALAAQNAKVWPTQPVVAGLPVINPATHPDPYDLRAKLAALSKPAAAAPAATASAAAPTAAVAAAGSLLNLHDAEWKVYAATGPSADNDAKATQQWVWYTSPVEVWLWQWEGAAAVTVHLLDGGKERSVSVKAGDIFLIPAGVPHAIDRPAGSVGVVVGLSRAKGTPFDLLSAHPPEARTKESTPRVETVINDLAAVAKLRASLLHTAALDSDL